MIGTTVKMDSLKEDLSDSQFAEKIISLSHEISKGLKKLNAKLVEEGYEETESEEETAGEITASEVVVAVVEENEFLESGTEEELVELQATEIGANEEAEAKISILNQKLLQLKEGVNHLEAQIESLWKESAEIVSKELEKKMVVLDSALKSKINIMDKELLCSNEKIRNLEQAIEKNKQKTQEKHKKT